MEKNIRQTSALNIVQYAFLITMVFIGTAVINIPMPWSKGGLVHIGDVVLFTIAIVFGKKKGAISAGLGMALFDILSPYAIWAPFTLVIRFFMGYVTGAIANSGNNNGENTVRNIVAILASLPILIGGYYIAEALLYGNWITPVNSIPGNLSQFAAGIIGALILSPALNRIPYIKNLKKFN